MSQEQTPVKPVEREAPKVEGPAPTRSILKVVIPCAIVLVIAYVVGIALFKATDGSYSVTGDETQVESGVKVSAIPVGIDPATEQLTLRLLMQPVGEYADDNGDMAKTVLVYVNSYSGKALIELAKGKPAPPEEIKIYAGGSWSQYPLDKYTGTLYIDAAEGPGEAAAVPTSVEGSTGLSGWSALVAKPDTINPDDSTEVTFTLSRPFVSQAYAAMALLLLVLIALAAATVAIAVGARRRKIEPALLGWGAALMFALPALRNAMPGVPPIGAWIDVVVFLWVMVLVILSYLVVLGTWLRKSPPPQ